MPCSVTMSISSSGAAGISPDAVRNGRASGATTARAVRERMVRESAWEPPIFPEW